MFLDIVFVLSIIGLASLPFIRMLWKAEIEACRYSFYEVRDALVLLVAKGELSKESSVFRYYYRRVNDVLRLTEKMHLEGLIEALRSGVGSKEDFQIYHQELQAVKIELSEHSDEIRKVVSQYYLTLSNSLLINSNFLSVAYLISRHHSRIAERLRLLGWAERREPRVSKAYEKIKDESAAVGLAV